MLGFSRPSALNNGLLSNLANGMFGFGPAGVPKFRLGKINKSMVDYHLHTFDSWPCSHSTVPANDRMHDTAMILYFKLSDHSLIEFWNIKYGLRKTCSVAPSSTIDSLIRTPSPMVTFLPMLTLGPICFDWRMKHCQSLCFKTHF